MERKRVKMFATILLALVLLTFAGIAVAQDKPADNMQILLEKIRADKKLVVAQNMQLTEGEGKAFWPLYEKYQAELFLLRARTARMIDAYAKAYNKMTNAAAKKLLDDYMTIEGLRLKLNKDYRPKFGEILPDIKVVRYFQIENKINAALYYELAASIPLIKMEQ
jgi:hypothetical protein